MATSTKDKAESIQTVDAGEQQVDGNNNAASKTTTVIQVPRPPRRDDGKWIAIGALAGSLAGMLFSKDLIDDAKKAEKNWTQLTKFFRDTGYKLNDYADKLIPCNDSLHEALCKFALCGYTADYEAALRRASYLAKINTDNAIQAAERATNRYHYGISCAANSEIRSAGVIAAVVAGTAAIQQEKENAFDKNFELLHVATTRMEADFLGRKRIAADFLSSAGANYGFLAQSLRATAKADVGDMQVLIASLGLLLPMLFGYCGASACEALDSIINTDESDDDPNGKNVVVKGGKTTTVNTDKSTKGP